MNSNAIHITNNDSRPGRSCNLLLESASQPGLTHNNFEEQYLLLREKENRIYTDLELTGLPNIDKVHPHYNEWQVRKNSFKKLQQYLANKKKFLEILEVGCGNGWLSNQLSVHVNCHVTGLDINRPELEQAARVFKTNTECVFMYGDIRSDLLPSKKFDAIVFAASIQYFPSLKDILNASRKLLKPGGEIHIIDTHFYTETAIEEARQRSRLHFNTLGFPAMSAMYFHHSLKEIKEFNPVILHDPLSLGNKFFKRISPFYRISIRKDL